MAKLPINVIDNYYDGNFTLIKQNNNSITLNTVNKFLDKNIVLNYNVRSATATLSTTANASIESITTNYNSSSNNFTVTGTGTITGTATLAINQTGWIQTGKTANISGTATLANVTLPIIGLGATISGTAKVTPTINKTSTTTTSGTAVNVGNAAATTTAPSSGYFISVQSTAQSSTIYAMPEVNSNGYGTLDHYNSTTASLSIGSNASSITYIPITTGIATANTASADITVSTNDGSNNGENISAILGNKTTTEPLDGYYLAFTASGSGSSKVTTAGWFQTGALSTASATSEIKYFPVATAVYSVTGGGLTTSTGYTSISSDGYYNGSTYNTSDKVDITTQTTAANGYYKITASGYGTVNRAAINRQVTTAGYLPVNANPIQVSANTNLSSNTATQAYYIKKSTLSSTTITPSINNQTVTISAGYYPTDRTVNVNAMPTSVPTTSYSNVGLGSYFTTGTSGDKDVTIIPQYSNLAGYVATHTNANNGGTGYLKIIESSVTATTSTRTDSYNILKGYCSSAQVAVYTSQPYGKYKIGNNTYKLTPEQEEALSETATGDQTIAVYTRSSSIVNRGSLSWDEGWIDAGSITPAIFANVPSSGINYLDLTESSAMPILDSGGKLYINKGYVDNIMVDLGQFIPDEANINSSEEIVSGSSGVNSDGELIVGSLNAYTSADLVATGNTVIVPGQGYFLATATKAIASGSYAVSQTQINPGTAGATVNINNQLTYGFTTTAPASAYVTIAPVINTTDWEISATAEITKAGYLTKGTQTTTYTGQISTVLGDTYYIPVVTPTFSGGTLTGSTSSTIAITNMIASTTATDYYIDSTAIGTATRAITQYSNTPGVIAQHTNATALIADSLSVSSTAPRVYIPEAVGSLTLTPGTGICNYSTATNATVSTTNTSGVQLVFTGAGLVNAVAQITQEGYMPVNNNLASGSTTSNSAQGSIYLTGVKIEAPNSGIRYFDIEVPNGSTQDFITFRFEVDTSGNVTIGPPPES